MFCSCVEKLYLIRRVKTVKIINDERYYKILKKKLTYSTVLHITKSPNDHWHNFNQLHTHNEPVHIAIIPTTMIQL